MRTLAIADIHGCFRSLQRLEEMARFTHEDQIILVGDHVDHGPDTRRVIEWMIDRHANGGSLIPLRGNHELLMLAARDGPEAEARWLDSGGEAVLRSYGARDPRQLPDDHWQFLRDVLRPYYETDTHFFVHANVDPARPLSDQNEQTLYWDSQVQRPRHRSGRTMICGHTPQRDGVPLDMGHAICIDTAACKGGWLTCLDVQAGYCWQANEEGEQREFPLRRERLSSAQRDI